MVVGSILQINVSDDVQPDGLDAMSPHSIKGSVTYLGHLTPQTSLIHPPRRLPGELIEPTIHPLVKGTKSFFGLGTGLVEGGYDL